MNTSESRKNKWIAGGAVMVMLLAGASILRIRSLQGQASPSNPIAQAAAMNAPRELSSDEQAHRLELVTHLRDTWKPWAEKHRSELRQMLAAAPTDVKVRDAVWTAVPDDPLFSAHMKEFSDALNPNGDSMKGEVFSWNAISKAKSASQMNAMAGDERQRRNWEESSAQWALQNDFAKQRDIVISQSIQPGTGSVSLWASGRVTEDTIDLNSKAPGRAIPYKRKEVLPPYDFLTSK